MTNRCEQSHRRYVVHQEQDQRFFKIKEYKLVFEQHIAYDIPLDECVHTVTYNTYGNSTKHPLSDFGRLFHKFLCLHHHHAPMETKVQAHKHKASIRRQHMQTSRKGTAAADRQEGQRMAGPNHAADHEAEHGQQNHYNKGALYDPKSGIFAFQQIFNPFVVQNMMQYKQHKHTDADPLVRRLPNTRRHRFFRCLPRSRL